MREVAGGVTERHVAPWSGLLRLAGITPAHQRPKPNPPLMAAIASTN
jgi:hypothetical protein